jgi:putative SOS response-associated peptidase YedK
VRRHPDTGGRHLDLLKWGLLPSWTKDPAKAQRPINCRSERVVRSGPFRGTFKRRRCIMPADASHEWQAMTAGKQPCTIAPQDGQPMAFTGLWEGFRWPDGEITRIFTIATTNANADVAALHNRMPVILEPADPPVWPGEAEGDFPALVHSSPRGTLRIWPVSNAVKAVRNNGPKLIGSLIL